MSILQHSWFGLLSLVAASQARLIVAQLRRNASTQDMVPAIQYAQDMNRAGQAAALECVTEAEGVSRFKCD